MVSKESRARIRMDKHRRIRHKLAGTALRPRLAVFRSNKNMYAQIIDDDNGVDWFFTELESIKSSVMWNNGVNYSPRVEEKNIERLQQLVW